MWKRAESTSSQVWNIWSLESMNIVIFTLMNWTGENFLEIAFVTIFLASLAFAISNKSDEGHCYFLVDLLCLLHHCSVARSTRSAISPTLLSPSTTSSSETGASLARRSVAEAASSGSSPSAVLVGCPPPASLKLVQTNLKASSIWVLVSSNETSKEPSGRGDTPVIRTGWIFSTSQLFSQVTRLTGWSWQQENVSGNRKQQTISKYSTLLARHLVSIQLESISVANLPVCPPK